MKSPIRKIDRALKQLYNIDHPFAAEKFVIKSSLVKNSGQGALLIQQKAGELNVGIFLDEKIRNELQRIPGWNLSGWSHDQLGAFAVASEEISHFNYFLHHQSQGRNVSQLELEVQGEIDKFLLAFFINYVRKETEDLVRQFEALLEQFFERYHLASHLSEEQKARYENANRLAQRFLTKYRTQLANRSKVEQALRLLRRFYRATLTEKLEMSSR